MPDPEGPETTQRIPVRVWLSMKVVFAGWKSECRQWRLRRFEIQKTADCLFDILHLFPDLFHLGLALNNELRDGGAAGLGGDGIELAGELLGKKVE